jgi:hypothetical protein
MARRRGRRSHPWNWAVWAGAGAGVALLASLVLAYGSTTPARVTPGSHVERSYAAACDLIATAYPPVVPPTGVRISTAEAASILSAMQRSRDAFLEEQVQGLATAIQAGSQEQLQRIVSGLQEPCGVRGIPPVT